MGIDPNRIIHVEGEGLLPPAYEPQFPADLKGNERVRVFPPSPPWHAVTSDDIILKMAGKSPQDERYWFFDEAFERKLPPSDWEGNPWKATGRKTYGSGRGLDDVPDGTILRFATRAKKVALPDLWSGYGLMIMSTRLLDAFYAKDRDAIVGRQVILLNSEGDALSEDYYLVDIVRVIPAIDIPNSVVDYCGPSFGQHAFLSKYVSSRVRDDLDPNWHVFRQTGFFGTGCGQPIVSLEFRKYLQETKPFVRNISFNACGELR